ncbi:MAG: M14 family metallopeptidase [Bacteroidales bacterium]|nr:M14 family metallopeptidase [Bacteroidales bacterium]
MKKFISVFILFITIHLLSPGQDELLTTAEKSNYESTSTYEEVIQFIQTLEESFDNLRIEKIAISIEGRDIPLLIIGDPLPLTYKDLIDDNRIVVYLQANIHAGEVEGKEATQMLARELLIGKLPKKILENVIVLICPILNADGNEKFNTKNRTNQNGPVNGVGVRHNGQYLDLNRDAMKLETPEIRGVVTEILNKWDPAIAVDCHTTNGSYHEEPVTFTWMMNPNGDRTLINYMRDDMMPQVSKALSEKYDVENIFYGEFIDRLNIDKGWISYAAEPRYLVNYIGIRNRLSILNENYVYADFKTRVNGSYNLLKSILEYAASHKAEIKQLLTDADAKTIKRGIEPAITDSFAIEYEGRPTPEKITIKAFEADTIPGVKGYWRYKQSDRKGTVTVDYFADYYSTKGVKLPYVYILSVYIPEVIEVLKTHGIQVEQTKEDITLEVERFKIKEIKPSGRLNQGHYTNSIKGEFVTEAKEFPEGTYVIRTAQPLGNLVSYLLEPQADDGLLKWNFFDRYMVPQWGRGYFPYPVYKVIVKIEIKSEMKQ